MEGIITQAEPAQALGLGVAVVEGVPSITLDNTPNLKYVLFILNELRMIGVIHQLMRLITIDTQSVMALDRQGPRGAIEGESRATPRESMGWGMKGRG